MAISKKEIASNVRSRILDSALELFTQSNYFSTSVHDIRRHADVSTGSVYHYFKSKEAIAEALYESTLKRFDSKMDEIMQSHENTRDRCRAVVEFLFQLTEKEPNVMIYVLQARHQEFLPESPPLCSSKPFSKMQQMVALGIKNNELRQMDRLVAASCLFGGPLRVIQLRLDNFIEHPITDMLDEVWQSSWRAVAAVQDTPNR